MTNLILYVEQVNTEDIMDSKDSEIQEILRSELSLVC